MIEYYLTSQVTAIIYTKINVQEIEGEQAEKIIRQELACLIQGRGPN